MQHLFFLSFGGDLCIHDPELYSSASVVLKWEQFAPPETFGILVVTPVEGVCRWQQKGRGQVYILLRGILSTIFRKEPQNKKYLALAVSNIIEAEKPHSATYQLRVMHAHTRAYICMCIYNLLKRQNLTCKSGVKQLNISSGKITPL